MKFKPTVYLFINSIVTTCLDKSLNEICIDETQSTESNIAKVPADEIIKYLKILYKSFGEEHELNSPVKWIMHYLCNDKDRINIKDEVVSKIKICLNSIKIFNNQRNALITILKKIEKGSDLNNISNNEFICIYLYYYHLDHNLISSHQVKINKSYFKDVIKLNAHLNSLNLAFPDISEDDSCSLIGDMGENLQKLKISFFTNFNILKILKKCKEDVKKPIELTFLHYKFDQKNLTHILDLLSSLKICKLSIVDCDFCTSESISIFKNICNNKNIKILSVNNNKISKNGFEHIINNMENTKMRLDSIFFNNITFDDKSFHRFLNKIKDIKKLKKLSLCNIEISSEIIKIISNILKDNKMLRDLMIEPGNENIDQIDNIINALKMNKTLLNITINSLKLSMNNFTSILRAIEENSESKIKKISFKGRRYLLNSAIDVQKLEFDNISKKISEKDIELTYNWVEEANK